MAQWEYQLSGDFLGATVTRMGRVSPPISLVQNRTGDFCAPFARLRRSAVQPSTQCTASVLAVHCILHANICNLSRKRLRPFPQTFATAPANVCGERRSFRNLSPMIFY